MGRPGLRPGQRLTRPDLHSYACDLKWSKVLNCRRARGVRDHAASRAMPMVRHRMPSPCSATSRHRYRLARHANRSPDWVPWAGLPASRGVKPPLVRSQRWRASIRNGSIARGVLGPGDDQRVGGVHDVGVPLALVGLGLAPRAPPLGCWRCSSSSTKEGASATRYQLRGSRLDAASRRRCLAPQCPGGSTWPASTRVGSSAACPRG